MCESSRPVKRFKPNYVPPVVTKYQVPPHIQSTYVQSLQSYAPPPSVSPSFSPYHRPPASTPISANSPQYPQQQWHGPFPPVPQQGVPPYGGTTNNQGPSPVRYEPPHPNSMLSQPKGVYTPPYGPDKQTSKSSESPATTINYPGSGPRPPSPNRNQASAASRHVSIDQSVSMESISEHEIEQDDLSLLDVPDLPKTIANTGL